MIHWSLSSIATNYITLSEADLDVNPVEWYL